MARLVLPIEGLAAITIALVPVLAVVTYLQQRPVVRAQEKLGWRLGVAAWSFNRFTFLEAVERTSALGLRYIEAFEGQRVRPDSEAKLTVDLPEEEEPGLSFERARHAGAPGLAGLAPVAGRAPLAPTTGRPVTLPAARR